jgi:hypothetical protein
MPTSKNSLGGAGQRQSKFSRFGSTGGRIKVDLVHSGNKLTERSVDTKLFAVEGHFLSKHFTSSHVELQVPSTRWSDESRSTFQMQPVIFMHSEHSRSFKHFWAWMPAHSR